MEAVNDANKTINPDEIMTTNSGYTLDEKLGLALKEPDEYTELIGFSVPSDVIMTKEKEQ